MRFSRNPYTFTVILLLATFASSAQNNKIDFDEAQWIWHPPLETEILGDFDASARYFRQELNIPESPALQSVEIITTCDNLFVLYINGRPVGESDANNSAWGRPKRFDLTSIVIPGRVVLAIEAINTLPGPSALLVKFVATFENGHQIIVNSDQNWRTAAEPVKNWEQPDFDDQKWSRALVIGDYGTAPWGKLSIPATAQPGDGEVGKVRAAAGKIAAASARQRVVKKDPAPDFKYPEAVVYVGKDCSLYNSEVAKYGKPGAYNSLGVTIFNPRKARLFPEHDLPAPMKIGRTLMLLKPGHPDAQPQVLHDAGKGAIGSPSVSFDGKWIYFSMAREGDSFFHLFRISAEGGEPEQLTDGPFFDIDPAELPDGRIVFTSTRIGTFEEYHSPPSRALYVMNPDGSDIHPITHTIIFDNEPEVMADGRIIFIRSDNFFDRGKVETFLHAIFPDGTRGQTEFGLDLGPEYGGRLRPFNCGSPAPMPDGRVAYLSSAGITIGRTGYAQHELQNLTLEAGDVAALPDNRLLCTIARRTAVQLGDKQVRDISYEKIAILDPTQEPAVLTTIFDTEGEALHSPVFLGPRPKPPVRPAQVSNPEKATGTLFCQDVRFTKNTTAGWDHVRAVRVIAGKGLTTRSGHSYIVHAGNETVELGTVPLAPDGSVHIEVPADTPIAFQAVTAEGRSELNEMSWLYVRPGEKRTCTGCHQPRQTTPIAGTPHAMALKTDPIKLLGGEDPHRFRGNNPAVTGLMELQFDRFREVAGLNRHADTKSPTATSNDEIEALIQHLLEGDNGLKISAAHRLAIFRNPKAAPALAHTLADPAREVRLAVTVALATCGTRNSIPPLLKTLSDRDPVVAQGAAMALENLTGHSEPFDPFVEKAECEQNANAWRTWFKNTSWDDIESALIKQIETGDRDQVRRAAVALGHTGSTTAGPALRAYLAREQSNNPFPEWRKAGHQGDNARFNSLDPVNPRTLQAVTRAIGYIKDTSAAPLLADVLITHADPATGNLFLAEAAAEALGRIATSEAEAALIEAFDGLKQYPDFTYWYGDHPALMSCHASPIHYFILEALDNITSTKADKILPHIIRSVPIDPDRALFIPNDDYETLAGRVLLRHTAGTEIIETCLAMLGDPNAKASPRFEKAISATIRCWGGHPGPENRAAQILSMVCRDQAYTPRIEAALKRYCVKDSGIQRVFNTGIPEVDALPVENWVSFFLARTLGNLANPQSADTLIDILKNSPTEAASGRPDPLGPGVLFLHNGLTPCWRAAVAWALGEIGDQAAAPVLLDVVRDFDNATDTRHAAAVALGNVGDVKTLNELQRLAADYPEHSTRLALRKAMVKIKK